jgi:hypothetical protein
MALTDIADADAILWLLFDREIYLDGMGAPQQWWNLIADA